MSEPTFQLNSYGGGAAPCYLAAVVQPTDLSFTLVGDFAGWVEPGGAPLGTSGNFRVELDKGFPNAEKVRCASINLSSGLVTVASGSGWNGRGSDQSSAAVHQPQSLQGGPCIPVWTATEAREANALVAALVSGEGGLGPQILSWAKIVSGSAGGTISTSVGTSNLIDCTAGNTILDLPVVSLGAVVKVARTDATANTLTVQVSGGLILGPGLSTGVGAIPLNARGSFVELQCDGTNWHVTAGAPDSGWLPFTYANSWASNGGPATGGSAAGYRKIGNIVRLGGSIHNGTNNAAFATALTAFGPMILGSSSLTGIEVPTAGGTTCQVTVSNTAVPSISASSGPTTVVLDGVTWTVD